MEEEFEERLAQLEKRTSANRAAIVVLSGIVGSLSPKAHDKMIDWGGGIVKAAIEKSPHAAEEIEDLFVSLAALTAQFTTPSGSDE